MKQKILFIIGLIASGTLLFFLFKDIDLEAFWARVTSFWHEGRIWGLLFFSYIYVILQGLRFSIIYPSRASILQHIGLNLSNHTGNILLPGRAGEAIRPLYLKRWWPETPLKEVIGWSIFEKFFEMISMILFVTLGLLYFEVWRPEESSTSVLFWGLTLAILFSIVLGIIRRQTKRIVSKSEKIFWTLSLSAMTWTANTLGVYSVTGDLKLSFALLVTMTVASAIPMLPAGLGATQWAAVALGKFVSLAQADALVYSSTIHLIWILVRITMGLPLLLFVWGWPKSRELDLVQQTQASASPIENSP